MTKEMPIKSEPQDNQDAFTCTISSADMQKRGLAPLRDILAREKSYEGLPPQFYGFLSRLALSPTATGRS